MSNKISKIKFQIITTLILALCAMFFLPQISQAVDQEVCPVGSELECSDAEGVETSDDKDNASDFDKTVYFFYGEECPHCQDEEKMIDELVEKYPEIEVKRYEVWHNQENLEFFQYFSKERDFGAEVVPTTVIGSQIYKGYASDELTGVEIKKSIFELYGIDEEVGERTINIPFFGQTEIASLSLPVITIVLGLIDGFNPCAMWALVALITVLISTRDKKKLRLIGATFLISSWLIYYIFMAVYLNTFVFLSAISVIRMMVGLLAIFAGGWYLKEFWTYDPTVCKVTSPKQQASIVGRMKELTKKRSLWLLLLGVVAIAFSVNLVEMMCSIGLPAVYSQIIALNDIPRWQHYLYLALYNSLYMLDDVVVFIIAAVSMNYVALNHKYDRWMKLVGGLLILTLGIILIFWPGLLSF